MKRNLLYVHNSNFDLNLANNVQVSNMIKAFSDEKANVDILTFGTDKIVKKKYKGFCSKFILLKSGKNSYIRSVKLLRKYNKIKSKYENIYTRDLFFAYFVSMFSKKKVIYELHHIPETKIWKTIFKKTLKKLEKLVVISNGLRKEIEKNYSYDNILVLHDGVDFKKFNLKKSRDKLRKELKLPLNKKIITYTGSIQKWKGSDTIFDLSKKLSKNELLVIIGGDKDQIKELKKDYSNILFVGYIDNSLVPLYLNSSDVLLIPNSGKYKISTQYTSPLKGFEYAASGVPIIASDIPSIRDIFTDSDIFFFKADSASSLYEQIKKIKTNSKEVDFKVKNAMKIAKKSTWNNRANKILKLYD